MYVSTIKYSWKFESIVNDSKQKKKYFCFRFSTLLTIFIVYKIYSHFINSFLFINAKLFSKDLAHVKLHLIGFFWLVSNSNKCQMMIKSCVNSNILFCLCVRHAIIFFALILILTFVIRLRLSSISNELISRVSTS